MLQCLTQLIILQTSIRFQLSANSSQPPITAALFFLQITRHFGGSLSSLVIICWSFHCVVFPKCAQRSLAMYRPMSSDARSGRGQFSPRAAPTSHDKCPFNVQNKFQHDTRVNIFLCVHNFFRCTSMLNAIFMAQHCTCGVKGVT